MGVILEGISTYVKTKIPIFIGILLYYGPHERLKFY